MTPDLPEEDAMTTYEAIRNLHVLAGTIALAAFWTAAWLRKGSGSHVNIGRAFMIAMAAVAITAVPLAVAMFMRGRPVNATVLLYIIVITVTPTWLAWRAVRDKGDFKRYTGAMFKGLAGVNLFAGATVLAIGLKFGNGLLMGISLIGLATGGFMVRYLCKEAPTDRRWWMERHYIGIIGAGIATHVAFLNLGLARLLPPDLGTTAQRLSWIVPFVVAGIARVYLDRKYGPKRRPAVPAQAVTAG
jgi:hypothetical protein